MKKIVLVCSLLCMAFLQRSLAQQNYPSQVEGRWDITIMKEGKNIPSWLEMRHSGRETLVGRFVYEFGSARPVAHVKYENGKFSFSIPPQWEPGKRYQDFEFILDPATDQLTGTMVYTDGKPYNWTAVRAPKLKRTTAPIWGPAIKLIGTDLTGWHTMGPNQWVVENGILKSSKSGSNIVTDQVFNDFKLHIEFKYPKGSNSGVYLRGRYEVQIEDNKGKEPLSTYLGGVYGFLPPSEMMAKDPGEWQSYDITLIGRMVTVVANGVTIIQNQEIPGITGGALDGNEAAPGPIFLQGDHGPIEFRNIIITPAK